MAKRKPKGKNFQEFNLDVPKPSKPRWRWGGLFLLLGAGMICAYVIGGGVKKPPVTLPTLAPTLAIPEIAEAQAAMATIVPTNMPSVTVAATATITPSVTPSATITDTPVVAVVQSQVIKATNPAAVTPESEVMLTVSPATTFYAGTGGANLRTCPQRNCASVVLLDTGMSVLVDAYINGEAVGAGNTIWYRTSYMGQVVYGYSGVMQAQPPTAPIVSGGSSSGGQTIIPVQSLPQQQTWSCSGNIYNCGDFSTCSEVTSYFNACPGDPSELDGDQDGIPCEALC